MTDILGRLSTSLADRYRVERELGQGGMATVYLAHDIRHDRKVALKLLRPELSAILGGERFLKEIRLTANLQHPHILALHDSGEADGLVYYVMPYIDGESLRDRLNREKQLPVEDAVRIAREVAGALDYAHRHGVVHRDIKPENILLHDGSALVADFGIALAASKTDGGSRMTETGMSLGTPHYMSPEQAMGEREITSRADVYALGCVLYEMLVGEPPFNGPTAQAIIARVMTEEPRGLTIQRKTIPPHVEAAVHQALSKLPADRFATAAQFGDALGRTDYVVPSTRAAAAAKSRAPARRLVSASPWALCLLLGGFAAWGWLRRPEPLPVARQRIVLRPTPFNPGGFSRNVAISPDGRTVVFMDTVGGVQLWSKEQGQLEATPVAGTLGAGGPTFSPDGQWIAFVADGRLKKVPRLGGSSIAIGDSANVNYPSIAWLDNGTILYNNQAYSLLAVHQDGGPARVVLPVATLGRGVVSATALPGGRGALIGACNAGCPQVDLRVVDLATDSVRVLSDEVVKGWHTRDGHVVFVRQDGGVFRVPFDLERLAFRSAPIPVLQGVRTVPGRADMQLGADGTLLYVAGASSSGGTPSEAVWVTREGVATPIDSGWSFVPAPSQGLALSPDGRRLALSVIASGSEDIWIKQLDRGPLTRLSFAGSNTRPIWSADGASVMYVSRGARGANEDLRARRADGTGAEATVLDVDRTIFEVALTRDTAQLIVRYGGPPTRDIYLWRRGDSAATRLLAADGYEEVAPALSPDGRWLAYASNESGRYEVYVRPFPNVDTGRWQVSRSGGNAPRWAHSGRELFYVDGGSNLVSTAVPPGASFTTGTERVLFSTSSYNFSTTHAIYDITRDDRRFVFVRALGGREPNAAPNHVIRVDHWLDELRTAERRR